MGRFVSVDPKGYADGPSPYTFVGNDPLNATDPMGLCLGFNDGPCSAVADKLDKKLDKFKKDHAATGSGIGAIIKDTAIGALTDTAKMFGTDPLRAGQATGDAVGSDAGVGQIALATVQDAGRVASLVGTAGVAVKAVGDAVKVAGKGAAAISKAASLEGVIDEAVSKGIKEGAAEGVADLTPKFNIPESDRAGWARMSGMLREAAKGKGNFGVGSATREEAQAMGEAWVGSGSKIASDGKTLISKDGLRQFRPPSYKPKLGKIQANLEQRPPT